MQGSEELRTILALPMKELGAGSFGQVGLYGENYVVKFIAIREPTHKHMFQKESAILKKVSDSANTRKYVPPFVLSEIFTNDRINYWGVIVQEYIPTRELFSFLEDDKKTFTEEEASETINELIKGLEALHELGLIHRDLKLENILLRINSSGRPEGSPIIIDFGLACYLKDCNKTQTLTGTPSYLPQNYIPEHRRKYENENKLHGLKKPLKESMIYVKPIYGKDTDYYALGKVIQIIIKYTNWTNKAIKDGWVDYAFSLRSRVVPQLAASASEYKNWTRIRAKLANLNNLRAKQQQNNKPNKPNNKSRKRGRNNNAGENNRNNGNNNNRSHKRIYYNNNRSQI